MKRKLRIGSVGGGVLKLLIRRFDGRCRSVNYDNITRFFCLPRSDRGEGCESQQQRQTAAIWLIENRPPEISGREGGGWLYNSSCPLLLQVGWLLFAVDRLLLLLDAVCSF